MRLPKIAVENPIFTIMMFLAILMFGLVSFFMLPKDMMPKIELPSLTVITIYPGASAQEVEEQVTEKLEQFLSAASNLKSIRSNSRENVSFVTLEFNWGEDLAEASNNVRDMIEFAKTELPSEARTPIVYKLTTSVMPVLIYSVEADGSYNALDKICDDQIASRLRRVQGVGTIIFIGQPEREIVVQCDPYRLAAYNLTPGQVAEAMKMQNIAIPAGQIDYGKMGIAVRMPAEFENVGEISEMPISSFNGQLIRICDVATVSDTLKESDNYIRSSGRSSVLMMVQKQSDANTLNVARAVRKQVGVIQESLPHDVKVTEVMDMSELVSASISNLGNTILYAALFVIIVVLFFLREFRSSLIIILTIPFSLISAFIFMQIAGFTINIISLLSLAVTIGMVVDNAVVVLENIKQHVDRGTRPKQAAIFATGEMGMAITSSTLTTIVVFLPMVFLGGLVGIMFKQLATLTVVTLMMSLFTALTLTPMLASRLLKKQTRNHVVRHGRLFQWSERLLDRLSEIYSHLIAWTLSHKKTALGIVIVVMLGTIAIGKSIGTDYIPNVDAGDLNAVIELNVGVNAEETARVARQVEQVILQEVPELRSMYSVSGQTEQGILTTVGFKEGTNIATVGAKLVLPDKRKRSATEIASAIRSRIQQIPEVEKVRVTGGSILLDGLMGAVKPIEVKITGNNLDDIGQTADLVQEKLSSLPSLVNLESTVDQGKPEIRILIDKHKASLMGINPAMVGLTLRQSIYGADASDYKERGDSYDITVRYAPEFRNDINQIKDITITTLLGESIPLSAIATVEESSGLLEIKHEAQQRVVYVTAELDDVSLSKAVKEVRKALEEIEVPTGVFVDLGGQMTDQQDSFGSLYLLFALGIVLVYMVMASQFGALRDPFIIILAVPMTLIGVIWAFAVTGVTLSIVSFFGVVMLLGIVVNNGIVLVDYTHLLRKRGQGLQEAIINAGKSRMRPVLITAFTTIFGMIPMAISNGLGSEIWKPLGITCIGGLLVATLITLFIIPLTYYFFHVREENGGIQ